MTARSTLTVTGWITSSATETLGGRPDSARVPLSRSEASGHLLDSKPTRGSRRTPEPVVDMTPNSRNHYSEGVWKSISRPNRKRTFRELPIKAAWTLNNW